jgi:hypothetical protein
VTFGIAPFEPPGVGIDVDHGHDVAMAPPPARDAPSGSRDAFEVRLVTIDYYMTKPTPGLDVTHSPFLGDVPVDKVRARRERGSWHPPPFGPPATTTR